MFDYTAFSQPCLWAVLFFCYLLGSIPFGLIFTRLGGFGDIRSFGSGNIGTTNVLRTGSKKLAAFTLLGDLLKGTIAVLCARYIFHHFLFASLADINNIYVPCAGFFAFLGHLFPIWLKFKGGKGIATYIGVLLGFMWPMALLFAFIWLSVAYISKYSSLSGILSVLFLPFFVFGFYGLYSAFFVALMSVIVILKHWGNIKRLIQGTENKIGAKKT